MGKNGGTKMTLSHMILHKSGHQNEAMYMCERVKECQVMPLPAAVCHELVSMRQSMCKSTAWKYCLLMHCFAAQVQQELQRADSLTHDLEERQARLKVDQQRLELQLAQAKEGEH